MTPKFMQLLEQCVLDGVILGHKRAYKHNDAPSESDINMSIVQEVMNEIHEWFDCDERTGLTVPPRKEWVGLTDKEILSAAEEVPITCIRQRDYDLHFAPIIEAKLKEKNNGSV